MTWTIILAFLQVFWPVIVGIIGSAVLWRWGGNGFGEARAWGVPILIALMKFILLGFNWWTLLYIVALWGMIQAFSYGISSPIHKFWVMMFGGKGSDGNYQPVEIATRAMCGFFWAIPAAIFALLTGGWVAFGVYTLFLTVANAFFGGVVKNVWVSECAVGASVATSLLV